MTTFLQKYSSKPKPRSSPRVPRVPVYDHTITRVVTNKLSGKPRSETVGCRVTPKRIELVSGERFNRSNGVRIMPLDARIWGSYRHTVLLDTLKRKTVWPTPEPAKKPR